MKHSIFFKTIAIALCAASLMGIIGGAAGALTLVEGDLYNRTVDQMLDEKLQETAYIFADQTALSYASRALGSCPEEMTRRYGVMPDCDYGYAILDAEGNVLDSLNPEMKDSAEVHTVPVSGQYMHLVSTETESQLLAKESESRLKANMDGLISASGEAIPAEGISINQVYFTDFNGQQIYEAYGDRDQCISTYFYSNGYTTNSSSYEHEPLNRVGFLFYGPDGQLVYHSFLEENEYDFPATEVYGVMFMSHDSDLYFQTEDPNGLGTLVCEGGRLRFISYLPAEETVAETIPETVPASVPETLPVETTIATETTVPMETTEVTEETEAPAQEETQAAEENTEEDHSEDYEESSDAGEEYNSEDSEESWEEEEHSSASADPEEEEYYEENYDSSDEENYSEETVSSEEETHAEEQADDSSQEEIDWAYLEQKAEERIIFEWLLAQGLLTEADRPEDVIPDSYLQRWLVERELIGAEQTLPEKAPATEETTPEETASEIAEPILINGKPLETYQVNRTEYMDSSTGEHTTAKYVYLPLPEWTVEVYLDRDTLGDAEFYDVLRAVRQYRQYLLPAIGICLLVFAVTAVYLCTAAGRKPKTDAVRASGLNRMPLDLYLGLGISAGAGIIALVGSTAHILLQRDLLLCCATVVGAAFAVCLLFVGFCFAFVAQAKTPGGFWWRNTLSVGFVLLCMRFLQWLERWLREKGLPRLGQLIRKLWDFTVHLTIRTYHLWEKAGHWLIDKLSACFRWIGKKLSRFFSLIPLTWQWVISGIFLIFLLFLGNITNSLFLLWAGLISALALVLYGSHCFGVLLESTRKMGKGDLGTKVEDKLMIGCFKDFASDLNELADVAMVAAQKQLKSERMKTELITNVSHDLKTPLTSIINYVDLMQKPHTQEEGEQYLEVLNRQSQRLKKLVDDLMDMSKASTGNMAVEITKVDAVESVNQALGEFADKLERARLYPVFRHSEDSVPIMADGKLVWRVLSNLLSNVIKYAMPNTRVYLDLTHVNEKVIISIKNISREELNIDAEALMERFVRGDVSRNTDGSGLGLNIAKSLMELQKGSLQLLVDGDLFKVTLIFPDAK